MNYDNDRQNYLGSATQKESARKFVQKNKSNRSSLSEPSYDYRDKLSAQTQLKLIIRELNETTNS